MTTMPIIQCSHARMLMSEHLDGRLSDDVLHALDQHVNMCSSCWAYWQALQKVSALFQTADFALPPPDFTARVMSRLSARADNERARQWAGALAWGSLAAAFVLVAAIFIVYALQLPAVAATRPSANILGLSMQVSNAVLWTVRLLDSSVVITQSLSRVIPAPLLLASLIWGLVGTIALSFTVAGLVGAYQPIKIATQHTRSTVTNHGNQ